MCLFQTVTIQALQVRRGSQGFSRDEVSALGVLANIYWRSFVTILFFSAAFAVTIATFSLPEAILLRTAQ